jgi:ADP-ribose pyrophosphatase YjhB (NUDIX family)
LSTATGIERDVATRGHAVVLLDEDHVVLLRELRGGSVHYLAPGVATREGETPGRAAARAALEWLGLNVDVSDLLFADTELGAEHYFFLATPRDAPEDERLKPQAREGMEPVILTRSALLAYPVRPVEIARLLHSA